MPKVEVITLRIIVAKDGPISAKSAAECILSDLGDFDTADRAVCVTIGEPMPATPKDEQEFVDWQKEIDEFDKEYKEFDKDE